MNKELCPDLKPLPDSAGSGHDTRYNSEIRLTTVEDTVQEIYMYMGSKGLVSQTWREETTTDFRIWYITEQQELNIVNSQLLNSQIFLQFEQTSYL